jgi:hypothetical protein
VSNKTRKVRVSLGHVRFPYISAKLTVSYNTSNKILQAPVLGLQASTKIFELGSTATETLVFAFLRRNKPPDIPSFLGQYTGLNKRTMMSHTITMEAPEVNHTTGTTEYSCSGSAVYMLEYSDIYSLKSKRFFYPRGPSDGSDIFAHTSALNGENTEDWTSFIYDWMGGMEYSTIPTA